MLDNVKESPEHIANWWTRGRRFFSEVKIELGRVTWPTRKEVWATTIVVILVSILFGVYLFVVDMGLSATIDWVFRKLGAA